MPEQLHVEPGPRVEHVVFPPSAIADFAIVRELGRGGMGIVYEAYDRDLDRHVALKVVRDQRVGSSSRLGDEAKAMARLTHPNVVAVHQVGTIDDQVFVVMELVRGETLSDWLRQVRPWREVVAMFVQAGEGLLAAHRAGLIHRDFKPSNVLVDHEGRARVGDFGLARSGDRSSTPALAIGSGSSQISGTPAYMAPEQQQGNGAIDARVDQFAFAVSLERALESARGKAPRRVRAALSRGRSLERDERFPELSQLLDELRASLGMRRRKVAVAAACAALGAGLAAVALSMSPSSSSCEVHVDAADQVWNPTVRAAQITSFSRARPSATVASASAASIVDDWVERWKLVRSSACAVEGSQRQARVECLDDQLQQLASQVERWQHPDAATVDRAVQAATMLPHPAACSGSSATIDPALRAKITMLDTQRRSGQTRRAHDGVAEMIALAESTAHPRALAAALLTAGRVERDNGNSQGARSLLARAAQEAGRAMDDGLLFEILLDEATVIVDLGHPRESLGLLDAAAALQARVGGDAAERVAIHRADALGQAGRAEEAITETMRVLPVLEARAARDPVARMQLSTALGQLAAAQLQVEREAARLTLVRVVALDENLYGPDHPEVAKSLHDLGAAEMQLERYDESSQHLQRALRIAIASFGERHPMVSTIYVTGAHLARLQDRADQAKQSYLSARDALIGVIPDDAPQFIAIEQGLGDIARAADNCKEALPHYTRAVQLLKKTGHGENEHAMQLTNLGFCLQDTGRIADARETLQLSIAEIDRLQLPRKWKSEPLAILADMEFAAGNKGRAIELEKAALAALEGAEGSDVEAMRKYEQDQLAAWTKR